MEPALTGLPYRYVFVSGLHRSGTSLVTRMIGSLSGVGAITHAPVPENEGVYLQGAIPHTAQSGRPMHFATDPEQHLTESHPLNRLETRQRLTLDWDHWFPAHTRWRVEKSPVNLTRMRLLQQLFPLTQFVVVVRHPEAVAAAVAKWVDRPAPALVDHWLDAHDQLLGDLPYLHAVHVLRYEDLVQAPSQVQAGLAAFLDIKAATDPAEAIRNGNADYAGSTRLSAAQVERASHWGYQAGLQIDPEWRMPVQHPLRNIKEAVDAANAPARR